MSLNIAYSSDEEDFSSTNDAFGISSLPAPKRSRVGEQESVKLDRADAAPHVLSEVGQRLSYSERYPILT